jgi:hypothetical protein
MQAIQPRELELTLSGDLRAVPHVRRFVSRWFQGVLDDAEATWRAELTCHELLENAVKCTIGDKATLAISIIDDTEYRRLIVSTRNYSSLADELVLQRDIAGIRAAADPLAHYQALMRETARRGDRSGLGLARVRAEAEMQLDTYAANGMVTVVAHTTLLRTSVQP